MKDSLCTYADREQMLIGYIYGEVDPRERARFDAHVADCAVCRREVAELGRVRAQLGRWTPPEAASVSGALSLSRKASETPGRWWHQVPAWAQVAAALLFLGVAVGIANLDVRYDGTGLTVRTGWTGPAPGSPAAPASTPRAPEPPPWRADFMALERQVRAELNSIALSSKAAPVRTLSDDEIVRRLRTLVTESERKQQSELALRVAEVVRDVQAQRRADLTNIDRSLGILQKDTGVEVMRQRQLLNSLAVRVSQRQ